MKSAVMVVVPDAVCTEIFPDPACIGTLVLIVVDVEE